MHLTIIYHITGLNNTVLATCRSTLSLLAVFVGGNESSWERKFRGAKVLGSESATEQKFH